MHSNPFWVQAAAYIQSLPKAEVSIPRLSASLRADL